MAVKIIINGKELSFEHIDEMVYELLGVTTDDLGYEKKEAYCRDKEGHIWYLDFPLEYVPSDDDSIIFDEPDIVLNIPEIKSALANRPPFFVVINKFGEVCDVGEYVKLRTRAQNAGVSAWQTRVEEIRKLPE